MITVAAVYSRPQFSELNTAPEDEECDENLDNEMHPVMTVNPVAYSVERTLAIRIFIVFHNDY